MSLSVPSETLESGFSECPLQDETVYGPVYSRRLGTSLGINPLPLSYKFCDFDCVYCQYGWTPEKKGRERLKRVAELAREIEDAFRKLADAGHRVDCITIAGNGEPTIHPDFPEFVTALLKLRDHYFPGVKTGILSDASQAYRPEIKEALEKLDERYMKLDAGSPELIEQINRPRGNFNYDKMLKGLKNLKAIVIQSLFMQGSYDNTGEIALREWSQTVRMLQPREVQIYTIDRRPADAGLRKVPSEELQRIARFCRSETGVPSIVFN